MSRLMLPRRLSALFLFAVCIAGGLAARVDLACAQATGSITGKVLVGKEPGAYANVIVVGTRRGAQADEAGNFAITLVPVGQQTVRVLLTGYDPKSVAVSVNAGPNAIGTINLGGEQKVVKQIEEIEVTAQRMIDTKSSTTKQTIIAEKLSELPVDNLREAVGHQGRHRRAGRRAALPRRPRRRGEVPVRRRRGLRSAVRRQRQHREPGGRRHRRALGRLRRRVRQRALGRGQRAAPRKAPTASAARCAGTPTATAIPTKTFDNFDRFTFGFGGPTPIKNLTYFATYEGTFSDTYLSSSMTQPQRTLLDFIQLGNRQSNQINTNFKLAYRPNPTQQAHVRDDQQPHDQHAVQPHVEPRGLREGDLRHDPHARAADDVLTPRYGTLVVHPGGLDVPVPMNLPDHVPTTDDRSTQLTAVWTNQLSRQDVWTTRVSRFSFNTLSSVGGKEPWEYEIQSPLYWSGNLDSAPRTIRTTPRTATSRPTPSAAHDHVDREERLLDARWKQHTVKTGIEAKYNRVQNLSAARCRTRRAHGLPGGTAPTS